MLSNIARRSHLLSRVAQARTFAAINSSNINLDSISGKDIHDSDPRTVGQVMFKLAGDSADRSEISDNIDEYFRQRFRKLSYEEARDIVSGLSSSDQHKKIESLDDKFWVWETLEESTRPHVDDMS